MADPLKVKAGDTLKIPVEVTYADNAAGAPVRIVGDFMPTLVDGREEFWLSRSTVEAAEHIPAPRVFKRGDWVKLNFSDPQSVRQNGIVLRLEQRTTVSLGSRVEVEVSWPDGQIHWYVPNDLEPDEAPE